MYNSILRFHENGIENIENMGADFFENPKDIASLVDGIKEEVLGLGCRIIGDIFEEMNEMICNSSLRREGYEVVRHDTKTLLTSMGEIRFSKTLFKNKKTGERCYLLDEILGIAKNARLTEDAEAEVLKEAVQTSYGRAAAAVSITDHISKGAVKNKIHALKFPEIEKEFREKKQVKFLYIDADEDHVPLQYIEQPGDIIRFPSGRKNNNVLSKLIYVYEGVESVAPQSSRFRLVNPHYFSGVYEGEDSKIIWEKVYEYIDGKYDLNQVEQIYLNADGGGWIKSGKSKIGGITTVLDEHHINQHLIRMTSHLGEQGEDVREHLKSMMRRGTKSDFNQVVEEIMICTVEESAQKRVMKSAGYFLSNWSAARIRLRKPNGIVGSSTEGHVSHVLASRMSSRPMGWSKTGVDRMSRLRAYWWNGGDMLELVRYQRESIEKAVGMEEIFSSEDMRMWEKEHHVKDGRYFDKLQSSPAAQVRKILAIRERIYNI